MRRSNDHAKAITFAPGGIVAGFYLGISVISAAGLRGAACDSREVIGRAKRLSNFPTTANRVEIGFPAELTGFIPKEWTQRTFAVCKLARLP
jgi:hypothetical protein